MKTKLKVFAKRLELASNFVAGACFSGAVALMYRDNAIDLTYWVMASLLTVFALVLYVGVTWFLMEIADADEQDAGTKDDDSG